MRAAALAVVAAVMATTSLTAPAPKITPLFSVDGVRIKSAESTRDGQRIYYQVDSTGVRVYDRRTKQHQTVYTGITSAVSVSGDGKTLLFEAPGEDGGKTYIWTLALNPATGAAAGTRRRVSMTWGEDPAFSSDAQSIAFIAKAKTPEEALVVVPASGGPEREILRTGGVYSVWPVRWTPDDKWLVYGYSENSTKKNAKNAIFRVPAAGGTPQQVMLTADWGAYPGLSPDGRTILAWDPSWDTTLVTTASGQRIAAYIADWGVAPDAWIDGTRALSVDNLARVVVETHALSGGAPRIISDTTAISYDPKWSPDGRRIAAATTRDNGLTIYDESGTATIVKTKNGGARHNGIYWSPDGKAIVYRGNDHLAALSVVTLATGAERELTRHSSQAIPVRWTAGGRSVVYGILDSIMAPDSSRRLEMHEATMSGQDRLLRTLITPCNPRSGNCLQYLNDSTVVSHGPDRQYLVMDLRGNAPGRLLLRRNDRSRQGVPTVSRNGHWVVVRQADANGEQRVIDLVGADGANRHTLTLPFRTAPGAENPWISDDGKELIVAGQASADEALIFYRVNVATGVPTKLFEEPRPSYGRLAGDGSAMGWLSPDWNTVVYTSQRPNRATVYELDYSDMLNAAGKSQRQ